MNSLQAVIFDMNGTVLCDEGRYTQSFKKVLADIGITDDFSLQKGISIYRSWQKIVETFDIQDQKIEDLVFVTQEEYKKMIDKVQIREGFFTLSEELKVNNIKRALATSNEQDITSFVIDHFDLSKHFEVVVTASDVNEVKPNPEIFVLAAELLKTSAQNSIVIEDAQAGVEAAKSGKFWVIGIEGNNLTDTDLMINDFSEITVEKLQEIVLK